MEDDDVDGWFRGFDPDTPGPSPAPSSREWINTFNDKQAELEKLRQQVAAKRKKDEETKRRNEEEAHKKELQQVMEESQKISEVERKLQLLSLQLDRERQARVEAEYAARKATEQAEMAQRQAHEQAKRIREDIKKAREKGLEEARLELEARERKKLIAARRKAFLAAKEQKEKQAKEDQRRNEEELGRVEALRLYELEMKRHEEDSQRLIKSLESVSSLGPEALTPDVAKPSFNCSACTFNNQGTRTDCAVCGTPRPIADWQCVQCTLMNPGHRATCSVCSHAKPTATNGIVTS